MKKLLAIGSVLVLLALTVVPGAAFADAGTDASFDLVFDGYCDGLHLNDLLDGTVDGDQTGCVSGPLLGTRNRPFTQGQAISVTFDSSAAYAGLFAVVRADHTWTIYANDGAGIYVINSGTWTKGIPPLGGGSSAAIQ